jgi:transcriptional regulator with XRE-family HTH domain
MKNISKKPKKACSWSSRASVSELLNGKIANKSIEKFLWYAGKLGIVPKVKFPQLRKHDVERELEEASTLAR